MGRTQKLKFPRHALHPNSAIEVHGFCDISIDAYGGCIYLVSIADGKREVHLFCSKYRVAPFKTLTVPELELCAALLLAQLMRDVRNMDLFDCPFYFWSDYAVALSWISDEPSRFQVFIANRISLIQELSSGINWHQSSRYLVKSCFPE
ncbi:uncharacterized protein LOC122320290 [Drosophila ficusphila]|uniref:uncharacterized protein LOC122320290 n=1 Tax=Drosophila ficusphila TaxID=30025 RepID=UPI001C8939BC|nr:uncharacterized protein LOC122320290 [Drosophila ficusphila]